MKRAEEPERSPEGRAKLSPSFQSFCLSSVAPPLYPDLSVCLRFHLSVSLSLSLSICLLSFSLPPSLSLSLCLRLLLRSNFGESPRKGLVNY